MGLAGDPKQAGILPKMDISLLAKLHEPAHALQRDQAALEIAQQEAKGYQTDAQRVGRELAVALGKPADWFESQDQDDVVSAASKRPAVRRLGFAEWMNLKKSSVAWGVNWRAWTSVASMLGGVNCCLGTWCALRRDVRLRRGIVLVRTVR